MSTGLHYIPKSCPWDYHSHVHGTTLHPIVMYRTLCASFLIRFRHFFPLYKCMIPNISQSFSRGTFDFELVISLKHIQTSPVLRRASLPLLFGDKPPRCQVGKPSAGRHARLKIGRKLGADYPPVTVVHGVTESRCIDNGQFELHAILYN